MTSKMNCKKSLAGGLAAGVFINLIEYVTHDVFLMERYSALMKMGYFKSEPGLYFMPGYLIVCMISGIVLAWFYAAMRDTMGPGAKTAVKIGFAVWLIGAVPANYAWAAWNASGKYLPFFSTIANFIEMVGGALIAGAIYKPKSDVSPTA